MTRTELSLLSPTAGIDAKPLPNARQRLAALEARVRRDLGYLDYPVLHWVHPRSHRSGAHVYDVVIVGAGQGGLATAFALRREKVDNVIVLDRAEAGREGPWITYARMLTFRSAKHVTGPDLGVPSLTPQAWYVAVHGEAAWAALGKWPRQVWQDYLIWYRRLLDLPVRNRTEVTALVPEGELVSVEAGDVSFLARKVVLATGIEGNGDWQLPDLAFSSIPPARFAHTNWEFDIAGLRGQRVAMLGAGASAFDTAAAALEAGAASVHHFVRRAAIPCINPFRLMERAGFLRHFGSMSDAQRWQWMSAITGNGQPPTQDGINRCAAFDTYICSLGVTWTGLAMIDGDIEVATSDGGRHRFDVLLLGTGYTVNLGQRRELAPFAAKIALWRDRFTPPPGEAASPIGAYPYLSADLSFQEKHPGTAPFLANIHNFTYMATASVGYSGASLTGMKYGVQRLLRGLLQFLWQSDADRHLQRIKAYRGIDLECGPLRRAPTLTTLHALGEAAVRLAGLEDEVRRDLRYLDYPAMPWVRPRTHRSLAHVHDVVIVGGGQGGLATAFGLRREKIDNVIVLDRAEAGREGPWITYARMRSFRSAKHVTGPDLGIPGLTPQAWFVAVYGEAAWENLDKWRPRAWQDYLIWYRHVLELPVQNGIEVIGLVPDDDLIRVEARRTSDGTRIAFLGRKIVLATGIEGNGDWQLPKLNFAALPAARFAHTNWEFDIAALRGQRVAVLGAGASAFDTAAAALEAGAALVHQFVRRPAIPTADPYRTMEHAGFLGQFGQMSDLQRWRWLRATRHQGVPPTQDGIDRCAAFDTYHLSLGVTWTGMTMQIDDIELSLSDGSCARFDFLVVGTGYAIDISQRRELHAFADRIALWRDRFTPPVGEETSAIAHYPYLADDLSFTEKVPGTAPFLARIHNFTYAARTNIGSSATALTSMKYAVTTLIDGLTRFFWREDCAEYLAEIRAYRDIDLDTEPLMARVREEAPT